MNPVETKIRIQLPLICRQGPMAFALSFVAGFVDTAGFVALCGLFTAHVTGNLVLVGAALARQEKYTVAARLGTLPLFMATVMFAAGLAHWCRRKEKPVLATLLSVEAVALVGFMIASVSWGYRLSSSENQLLLFLIGGTGVIAMAIHNSLMRIAPMGLPQTTVMTGNLTLLSVDATTALLRLSKSRHILPDEERQASARIGRILPALAGFLLGATLGGFGIRYFRGWCIAIPALVIAYLAGAAFIHPATDNWSPQVHEPAEHA